LTIVLVLACAATSLLSAGQTDSEYYIKTFYAEKVYPHLLGYKVDYRTAGGILATTYIPIKWFAGTASKAILVQAEDPSGPYMEVVYKKGKFAYVKLHVWPSFLHPTWGVIRPSENMETNFAVEELKLAF